ncbi:MAG: GTPase ObgE [Candidatus Marinimicrobia bacterium]|nr:GTPase ObgE [Candidatus Neomarinimicrobiota bacterium]MBL7023366.1 GTPase ObgE [Candidatus Neomarinimicrobiota bacterium]MBL7109325.1 GTPase ObgE [Candidatus Neomarinimicrobiota bacterium]
MKFIDQAKIHVKAGGGGHGCIAFLREKFRPKGGPCGGDGGSGGNIILEVNPQLNTLQDISYNRHYKADRGQHGMGTNKHGKNAADVIIFVPPGTIVRDFDTQEILCDLVEKEDYFVVAQGGNGGFGNARFKTKIQTAPRIANDGQPGEERTIELELKVLADVGLVGFPNAGKSTFLSVVSAAKPKIADYPFTTLVPNLGIVKHSGYKSFVMADIPGLIEGASDGKGLGSQFLKHIERTKILVFIIDGSSDNIENQYYTLRTELEKHHSQLNNRPSLLLITKKDIWEDESLVEIPNLENTETVFISSVTQENLSKAINNIAKLLESQINDTITSTD